METVFLVWIIEDDGNYGNSKELVDVFARQDDAIDARDAEIAQDPAHMVVEIEERLLK